MYETNILRAISFCIVKFTPRNEEKKNNERKPRELLLPGLFSQFSDIYVSFNSRIHFIWLHENSDDKKTNQCVCAQRQRHTRKKGKYKQKRNKTKKSNWTNKRKIIVGTLLCIRCIKRMKCVLHSLLSLSLSPCRFEMYSLSSDRFRIERITK